MVKILSYFQISLVAELSKGFTEKELSAVLELLENAVKEIKEHFDKINVPSETPKDNADTNEVVVTVTIPSKRKRGRPRKDQSAPPKQITTDDVESVKDEQPENVRRTSKRTIVPSKRYPNLLATFARQEAAEDDLTDKFEKTESPMKSESQKEEQNPGGNSPISNGSVAVTTKEELDDDCGQENKPGSQKVKKKIGVFKNNKCTVCGKEYNNRSNLLGECCCTYST